MAEAATVIQLMQFSGVVLSQCYNYVSKAKNAPKEIQNAIGEVSGLRSNLKHLKPLAEDSSDYRFMILKSLNQPKGPFMDCSETLKALEKKLTALTEASDVRRRLQWPLEAKKIDELLKKLDGHKTAFILALTGDTAKLTAEIEEAISDIKSTVVDIRAKEQRDRILEWLKGPEPSTNHHAAQKKKEAGTCEWLLNSTQFKAFGEGDNQLMWLHGIPGAGKTVLTSTVVEHLSGASFKRIQMVIYYFFDFTDNHKQTCHGCLRSLVRQVCSQSASLPAKIEALYDECKGASPSADQLLETLVSLLEQIPLTFIIIDALDECGGSEEDEERSAMLNALIEMKSSAGLCNVFVASRPEADITREMTDICDIDVDLQAVLVDEDIRCHVRSCLTNDARLKKWPQPVKTEIEETLLKGANGM